MREAMREEWVRLNPTFVGPNDTVAQVVCHAAKETLYGFFAPLLMLRWLIKTMWSSLRL